MTNSTHLALSQKLLSTEWVSNIRVISLSILVRDRLLVIALLIEANGVQNALSEEADGTGRSTHRQRRNTRRRYPPPPTVDSLQVRARTAIVSKQIIIGVLSATTSDER